MNINSVCRLTNTLEKAFKSIRDSSSSLDARTCTNEEELLKVAEYLIAAGVFLPPCIVHPESTYSICAASNGKIQVRRDVSYRWSEISECYSTTEANRTLELWKRESNFMDEKTAAGPKWEVPVSED